MGKGVERRRNIFQKFASNLIVLSKNGELHNIDLTDEFIYICPICLKKFVEKDIKQDSENMLTLEDSPPESLGGKKVALTCKKCNNESGHNLDFHIKEKMLELDSIEFLENSSIKAKTTIEGVSVNSEVRVTDNKIEVKFSWKNNNPSDIKQYLEKITPGKKVNVEPKSSRVDINKFEIALLKSAYILAFSKLGYGLILNSSYNIVREQLKNTDSKIYPEGFWTIQDFNEDQEGVHFIIDNKKYVGIFVIFPLSTKSSVRRFGVILPFPGFDINSTIEKMKKLNAGNEIILEKTDRKNYLTDIDVIRDLKRNFYNQNTIQHNKFR